MVVVGVVVVVVGVVVVVVVVVAVLKASLTGFGVSVGSDRAVLEHVDRLDERHALQRLHLYIGVVWGYVGVI